MVVKSTTNALINSAMLALPMSGCYNRTMPAAPSTKPPISDTKISGAPQKDTFVVSPKKESPFTKGFTRIVTPNIKGNMIEEFEEESLDELVEKLYDTTDAPLKYVLPIDTTHKPYIAADGIFGAPRGVLPNLGLDISVKNDSTSKPIAILAPTKGVIIKQRRPLKTNGVQETKIMGTDGLIYSFKFVGKVKDYAAAKLPYMPKLGTEVEYGDTLGLMSPQRGQAESKLHLEVEDLNTQFAQRKNYTWQMLNNCFGVEIKGQINPLDSNQAGDIAKTLNRYAQEKGGKILSITKSLENLR